MSLQIIEIGTMAGMYVGDSTSGSPLTKIFSQRTGGSTAAYKIPETFLDVADNSVQSGRHQLITNLIFLSDEDASVVLAMGNQQSVTPADTPSAFGTLSVFFIHPDGANGNHSIYIPKCYAIKALNLNHQKDKPTECPIQLFATNRNRFIQLFYKRDNATLKGIMGSKSPI